MASGIFRRARPVHLALQGGGAHGALTWGVLDRLLEDGGLSIRAISGTSAGAMNAVVLADGFARGGPAGAREALAAFWTAVGEAGRLSPMRRGLWDRLRGRYSLDGSPGYLWLDGLARLISPNALNPFGAGPLRDILSSQVDFGRVAKGPIAVHVTATSVRTGEPRVFSGDELGVEAVLASACLPQLHRPVEIDGEAYWDGGFSGNPALGPLVADRRSRDVVIVQLNPVERPEAPRGAREIINRMNEISFNAPLLAELRALGARRGLRLHRIDGAAGMAEMAASSKLDAEWGLLELLHERGRCVAGAWLEEHRARVGVASTLDGGRTWGLRRLAGLRRRAMRRWRSRRGRVQAAAMPRG
jgi:NTE family protein